MKEQKNNRFTCDEVLLKNQQTCQSVDFRQSFRFCQLCQNYQFCQSCQIDRIYFFNGFCKLERDNTLTHKVDNQAALTVSYTDDASFYASRRVSW